MNPVLQRFAFDNEGVLGSLVQFCPFDAFDSLLLDCISLLMSQIFVFFAVLKLGLVHSFTYLHYKLPLDHCELYYLRIIFVKGTNFRLPI